MKKHPRILQEFEKYLGEKYVTYISPVLVREFIYIIQIFPVVLYKTENMKRQISQFYYSCYLCNVAWGESISSTSSYPSPRLLTATHSNGDYAIADP